ncbi:MAG: biopolymer transporter ExbD [Myxococcota bacterium]
MRTKRRRSREQPVDEAEESGELNLVPYLDVVTTLNIFLIFTFQVAIEFRLIDLLPPAYSANARNASDTPQEKETTLTLIITDDSYRLVTNKAEMGSVEVKRKPDGAYDNDRLTQELHKVKTDLGLGESLIVTATDATEYKVVVAAMDAARMFEGQLLFPDVLLAKASLGGGGE